MRLPMRKAFKPAPESIRFKTGVLRHRAKAISPAYEGPINETAIGKGQKFRNSAAFPHISLRGDLFEKTVCGMHVNCLFACTDCT